MKKTTLKDYRMRVSRYFEMEYSDISLQQALLRLPIKYSEKMEKLIRLFFSLKREPADAAGRAMRFLRPPFRPSLIVGQQEEREWAADSEKSG